jgi:DNA (cytosine-5)-methyltransferase 1
VTLLAGGPPCQGFSLAGKRKSNDPRNELFKHYVAIVEVLRPQFLLLENVKGISVAFRKPAKGKRRARRSKPFSERIKKNLEAAGYKVYARLIRAMEVGVPQFRPRYILLAIRQDLVEDSPQFDPFGDFKARRKEFLSAKGLPADRPITVRQAISDLETEGAALIDCIDSPRFKQIRYTRPRTNYQRLLHGNLNGTAPNSLRLAKHSDEIEERFSEIISSCRKGVQLNAADRKRFGLKKHCVVPLNPARPSHTLTTLPDDFLHYSEPRILTVREYARLQSFPDWYAFRGKYTTGGDRRLRECPRYTQAGNAVPPFLAEFLGNLVKDAIRELDAARATCRRT